MLSGSMEPYVPRGSLVVVIPEYPGLGDVGAYRLEEGGKTYVIVHRVVGLGDGFYAFKGGRLASRRDCLLGSWGAM
jgi:signal peptidase I